MSDAPSGNKESTGSTNHGATTSTWKELPVPTGRGRGDDPSNHLLYQVTTLTTQESRPIQSNETVLINLTGRQADNLQHHNGPIFFQAKSWLVTVGDPWVLIRPLEWVLEQLQEKETALLYIDASSKYHPFQQTTGTTTTTTTIRKFKDYTLPTGSHLLYEIQVLQIVMDTSRLNPYFPIQKALTLKNIANDLYQNEWERVSPAADTASTTATTTPTGKNARERAIYLYEKSSKIVKTLLEGTYFANVVEPDHPQRKQCETILIDCYNNLIAVYLRTKRWSKAREVARLAISTHHDNPKTHIRNVKAHVLDPNRLQVVEETEHAFRQAENGICYKDANEEKELKQLRAKWNKTKQQGQS